MQTIIDVAIRNIKMIFTEVSRSLDNELQFQRANQSTLFGLSNDDNPIDETRESSTKSSFLSDSVTGKFVNNNLFNILLF